MAIVVTTRRALKAMRHQRQRSGDEEGWIEEAFACLESGRPIPTQIASKLKRFASICLRWR